MSYVINNRVSSDVTYYKKYWELTNNIDLNNQEWVAIGGGERGTSSTFYGYFEGNNHTISNISNRSGIWYYGLFGVINYGSVNNLYIDNFSLITKTELSQTQSSGALAGMIQACVNVENVHASNVQIETASFCGGLIGNITKINGDPDTGGYVKNCSVTNVDILLSGERAKQNSAGEIGGFVGMVNLNDNIDSYDITDCSVSGKIKLTNTVGISTEHAQSGGFVGYAVAANFTNCHADVDVVADSLGTVGGFAGIISSDDEATVTNCYATGDVTGTFNVGGFVGYSYYRFNNCYATGDVYGGSNAGGFAGYGDTSKFTECYATGVVNGSWCVGGFAGIGDYSTLTKCHATGSVSSNDWKTGGLVGVGWGINMSQCYATGSVTNTLASNIQGRVGGLIGETVDGTISDCYSTSDINAGAWVGGIVGLTCKQQDGKWYTTSTTVNNSYFSGSFTTLVPAQTYPSVFFQTTPTNCYFNKELLVDGTYNATEEAKISTGLTSEQFATSELAWKLNTSDGTIKNTGIWAKGTNGPVFATNDNKAVYKISITGDYTEDIYTNSNGCAESLPSGYTFKYNNVDFNISTTVDEDIEILSHKISSNVGISSVTLNGVAGTIDENVITINLPSGSQLPTDAELLNIQLLDSNSSISNLKTDDEGKSWSFTVTAEDGVTVENYTINVSVLIEINGFDSPVVEPEPETPEISTNEDNSTISVQVSPEIDGNTSTATVDNSTIDKLTQEAAKSEGDSTSIIINVSAPLDATAVNTVISSDSLASIATSNIDTVNIVTPVGSLSFDSVALSTIGNQINDKNATISISQVDNSTLSEKQQKSVGSRPVIDLSIIAGDKYITSFGGGTVSIKIPYELKPEEKSSGIVVYYLDKKGDLEKVKGKYNEKSKCVEFETVHFSKYVIGYDKSAAWENPFIDVKEGSWYYDYVAYIAESDIMHGLTTDTFGPNEGTNRAMITTMLYRMAGSPAVSASNNGIFADVKTGMYYTDAVNWAISTNIVNGMGENTVGDKIFAPNTNVSRQDLAVMLYRNAAPDEISLDYSLEQFKDQTQIARYAVTAMKWAVQNGIISGKTETTLDPMGTATRAEVAAMIQRYNEKFSR